MKLAPGRRMLGLLTALTLFAELSLVPSVFAADFPSIITKVESYTVWLTPQEARLADTPSPAPTQQQRLQVTVQLDGGGKADYITTNADDMRAVIQVLALAHQTKSTLHVQHVGSQVLAFHLEPPSK